MVRVAVTRRGAPGRVDSLTLRFGAERSVVETPPLAAGVYDVRAPGGASLLVVNPSREWLPRPATVRSGRVGGAAAAGTAPGLRSLGWIYLLAVLAFCAEWIVRRRAGLR